MPYTSKANVIFIRFKANFALCAQGQMRTTILPLAWLDSIALWASRMSSN